MMKLNPFVKIFSKRQAEPLPQSSPSPEVVNHEAPRRLAEQNLRQKFAHALGVLRNTSAGNTQATGWAQWLSKLDWNSPAYRLPWFIVLGAQGSGKSTLVNSSGLKFPLNQESKEKQEPTEQCNFLFADQAVLLDVAGRYCTHSLDRKQDANEWNFLLGLLKKHRPRQPINGVLFTLAVDELLQGDPTALENQANAIRSRMQELQQAFGMEIPVYFMLSKMDLLAGFNEFFDSLNAQEREQVWGVTLPLPSHRTQPLSLQILNNEWQAQATRLQALLVQKLQNETDAERRAVLGLFPQSFRCIQPALWAFINTAFGSNPYQARILLRGVYMGSAAQTGSPLDALFQAASELNLKTSFAHKQTQLNPSRPYFLASFFRELLLVESHLAGSQLSWYRKHTVLKAAAYGCLALVSLVAFSSLVVSYQKNREVVNQVAARTAKAQEKLAGNVVSTNQEMLEILPLLNSVRDIALAHNLGQNTFGFSQEQKLNDAANAAYKQMLQDIFPAQMKYRMEAALREFPATQPNADIAYETLKAYLMLHQPKHYQAQDIKAWVLEDWKRNLPANTTEAQKASLNLHLQTLLAQGQLQSKTNVDDALVQAVRARLNTTDLPRRVYSRLKTLGVGKDIPVFNALNLAGPSASLVFVRNSGKPLSDPVSSLFTAEGYVKAFLPQIEPMVQSMLGEQSWVLQTAPALELKNTDQLKTHRDAVKKLYLNEYAEVWWQFVNDFRLVPQQNLQQSIQVARTLSGPDSPLMPFLQAITVETSLVPHADALRNANAGKAMPIVKAVEQKYGSLIGRLGINQNSVREEKLEYIVDRRFSFIHRLVEGNPSSPPPMDASIKLINDLYTYLSAASFAGQNKTALPPSDIPQRLTTEAQRLPEPLSAMLQNLAKTGEAHVRGVYKDNLSGLMANTLGETCARMLRDRYPFNRDSTEDIPRDDFAQLFAAGGLFDAFFQKNLASTVDTSTKPWTFKPGMGSSSPEPSTALLAFQRAATIKDTFFRGNSQQQIAFTIKPVELDASLQQVVLDLDGQILRYRHGPIVPMQMVWPSPNGSGQVRISMNAINGADIGGQTFDGQWALWHALDKAKVENGERPEKIQATFVIQGKYAKFEIVSSTTQNPFRLSELRQFSCPTGL